MNRSLPGCREKRKGILHGQKHGGVGAPEEESEAGEIDKEENLCDRDAKKLEK